MLLVFIQKVFPPTLNGNSIAVFMHEPTSFQDFLNANLDALLDCFIKEYQERTALGGPKSGGSKADFTPTEQTHPKPAGTSSCFPKTKSTVWCSVEPKDTGVCGLGS